MNDKLVTYLPLLGIAIVLSFSIYAFFNAGNKNENTPVNNVIKNIGNTKAVNNLKPEGTVMEKTKMPTPTQVINVDKNYTAIFKTNKGDIKIKLYSKSTPITVNNFVYLAKNKFYDGTIFHRVIKDFMIQGGDPLGNGTGGPGYKFQDEVSDKKLIKGSLAMANAGPNTNGSQFFIVTTKETPWLDGKHTNFGEVIDGIKVVEEIEKTKTGPQDRPIEEIKITTIEIIEE
jgi:cyclophilin family peptidyl-prolyl cis-trans isomerase